MKKVLIGIGISMGVVLLGFIIYFGFTPNGKAAWNNYWNDMRQVDDDTNYETRKLVEDHCRALIASYNTDLATYLNFKDSSDEVLKSSANQALIRLNQTANTYNEYILKNSYVWKDNVPSDIFMSLEVIIKEGNE